MTDATLKRIAQNIFKAERIANENQFETGTSARRSLSRIAGLLLTVVQELAEQGVVPEDLKK